METQFDDTVETRRDNAVESWHDDAVETQHCGPAVKTWHNVTVETQWRRSLTLPQWRRAAEDHLRADWSQNAEPTAQCRGQLAPRGGIHAA